MRDAYQHLVVLDHRLFDFAELERIGAVRLVDDRPHRLSLIRHRALSLVTVVDVCRSLTYAVSLWRKLKRTP